jgi:hypothetical protein
MKYIDFSEMISDDRLAGKVIPFKLSCAPVY